MFRPASMVKVSITGMKVELERTVEALEGLQLVHIVEPGEFEDGFSGGKPLDYGARASAQLLEIRGLTKILEVEGGDPHHPYPSIEITNQLDRKLTEIAGPVKKLQKRLGTTRKALEESLSQAERLELFQGLGLRLDDLLGYRSLEVFTGVVETRGIEAFLREIPLGEVLSTDLLSVFFTPMEDSEKAQQVLSNHGFKPVEAPIGTNEPEILLSETLRKAAELEKELEALEAEREALTSRHGNWLAAAEELLSIEAGKSMLPLSLTASACTFLLEGWVPGKDVKRLQGVLNKLDTHLEQGSRGEDDGSEPPPVKLQNPGPIRPMEFITKLFATPKHTELDPTALIFVTLPLFFGLMVSDAGYGAIYILMGYLVVTRFPHNKELVKLGQVIIIGGIWTTVFGVFLFTEAFGMHFSEIAGRMGFDLHWEPIFDKFDREHSHFGDRSVTMLLIISLILGISHMTLAFVLGMINIFRAHSLTHGILEKGSWLVILWGLVLFIPYYFLDSGIQSVAYLGIALTIVGCILLLMGEGPMALMEIFSVISNGLSYLRLVAVGLADAALASLVNTLSGSMFLPVGILLWVVGHLSIVLLGLLGSGINALRLHYVEFLPKFFEGGGTDYAPFGFKRTLIQSPKIMEAN